MDDDDDFDLYGDLDEGERQPPKKQETQTSQSATAEITTSSVPASSSAAPEDTTSVDDLMAALQDSKPNLDSPTHLKSKTGGKVIFDSGPAENVFYDSGPYDPNAHVMDQETAKNKGSLAIVSESESDEEDMIISTGVSAEQSRVTDTTPGPRSGAKRMGSTTHRSHTGTRLGEVSKEKTRVIFVSVPPAVPAVLSGEDPAKCCILVTRLPMSLSDSELSRQATAFGSVRLIRFWEHTSTGMSTGLAVIQYTSEQAPGRACDPEKGFAKVQSEPVVEKLPERFYHEMSNGVIPWLEGGELTGKLRQLLHQKYGRQDAKVVTSGKRKSPDRRQRSRGRTPPQETQDANGQTVIHAPKIQYTNDANGSGGGNWASKLKNLKQSMNMGPPAKRPRH